MDRTIVNQILSIIIQEAHPDKIILFGSQAKGNQNESSDYDFLLLKHKIENERDVTRPIYRALCEKSIVISVRSQTHMFHQIFCSINSNVLNQ